MKAISNNKKNKKLFSANVKENIAGYLFILPLFIGASLITFVPLVSSFILSFTDWSLIRGIGDASFIGLDNFKELFTDTIFRRSLLHNIILLLVVPIGLLFSLVLAVIINKYIYLKETFKIIFFLPFISSMVAVAIVYQVLFHPTSGPVNNFLMAIGFENPPMWLADPDVALISVMIIIIWTQVGLQLILYLAALQNIPEDLYQAADLDGATAFTKFKNITVPLVTPTTFLLFVTGLIHTFKVFDLIYVLTEGGPSNSTNVPVVYLYEEAFEELHSGYASAVGVIILLAVLLITVIQWIGQRKWVNY